eukprot:m.128842 g.128842  ORF g.128842 m.128842 type:complete len:376 (-) comp13877_c0_seq1:286-1413(-)
MSFNNVGDDLLVRFEPQPNTKATGLRYAVVGGSGVLGGHLVEALLARGDTNISILDLAYPRIFDKELKAGTIQFHKIDVRDFDSVQAAIKGCNVVFHTAALVDFCGTFPWEEKRVLDINFGGTQNIVKACQMHGVSKLLFTSSTSVVLNEDFHKNPLVSVSEDEAPIATTYPCHYVKSKILAEKVVLESNSPSLATAAIRPGGIYGPRDLFATRVIARGLPNISGAKNTNWVEYSYVENICHAFLLLEDKLEYGSKVAGEAYFVTDRKEEDNADDYTLSFFYNHLADQLNKKVTFLPGILVWALAYIMYFLVMISGGALSPYLGEAGHLRPIALRLARAQWSMRHDKAKRDFGYEPLYSLREGIDRTAEHLKNFF